MEKKNNNGMLVGILIGVIIMLLVFIALLAIGTISFKSTNTDKTEIDNTQLNDNETDEKITKEEATNILKIAADRIGNVSNGYPYCGENMEHDDIDAIFDEHNMSTHNASKDYTSLNNLKEDLKKYMSDELIDKYIKVSYYVEKDQKLYCVTPHKGGNFYNKSDSNYTIEMFNNDEIIAKGIIAISGEGEYKSKNNVNIEMKKNNDNWQITKYEVQ